MAKYNYDEAGNMASYFLITFLALVLVPLTLSSLSRPNKPSNGCPCSQCGEQRRRIQSHSKTTINKKTCLVILGWSLFAYVAYRVANAKLDNKIYDPFEILGIRVGSTEKEIKSHYKKLSKIYHPDKVKATINQTIEEIQNRFVELTKAYKSLTDETIRDNLEKYGHPDGRQDVSMGIALPQWIVEGKNHIWVLGLYGILFGGALPALVGRWWFSSRQKTKDGVHASSAAAFFKSLREESTIEEVIGTFGKAYQWELPPVQAKSCPELGQLEQAIRARARARWDEVKRFCGQDPARQKGLILVYAHLFRIPVNHPSLEREQREILLQTPLLLSALLNISISRNWLTPTLATMRFHAYLVQALLPAAGSSPFAQLPNIKADELTTLASEAEDIGDFVNAIEEKKDGRAADMRKALERWGRPEIIDVAFKVIGDRIVTPSSIIFLVIKLRLNPLMPAPMEKQQLDIDEIKRRIRLNEAKDEEFLISRKEAEEPFSDDSISAAHAPYWPGERKPSWWVVLGDEKANRVVVPPMRITDIPFSHPNSERDYRLYKIQFQAPQAVGVFTWKVYLISDTFVGEDISCDISLKIEDVSTLNAEDPTEDEISDPDEDSISGQMALMRGGKVKKARTQEDEESDEESSTDDDEDSAGSCSDSDSD